MPEYPAEAYATPALANERFYGAFNALDADAMRRVWREAEHIVCIHPGRKALRGDDVLEGWEAIFENASGMQVSFLDGRVVERGPVAVFTGIEEVTNFLVSPSIAQLTVTNVYEYDEADGRWYCFLHHAAPCIVDESAEDVADFESFGDSDAPPS